MLPTHFQCQSLKPKWPKATLLPYLSFRFPQSKNKQRKFNLVPLCGKCFEYLHALLTVLMEQIKDRVQRLTRLLIANYVLHQVCTPQVLLDVKNISHLSSISDSSNFLDGKTFISVAETALIVSVSILNLLRGTHVLQVHLGWFPGSLLSNHPQAIYGHFSFHGVNSLLRLF